jgi:hypothetical protein
MAIINKQIKLEHKRKKKYWIVKTKRKIKYQIAETEWKIKYQI